MVHHHDHGHAHALPKNYSRAFGFGILLNAAYIVIEILAGWFYHSMALVSDGIHNLSDVLGMALSWGAFILMSRKPTQNFTYGYGRATILAAYMNALILFIAVGGLGWEAVLRMQNPEPVQGGAIALVSGVGIIINAITAWMFFKDRKQDLNIKATFLHMAGDALISVGVLVSGIVIRYTGWNILDPVVSLVLLAVVVAGTWGLLRDSVLQILDRVPRHINLEEVEDYMLRTDGVKSIHDLHIWNLTTQTIALTAHLVLDINKDTNVVLNNLQHTLAEKFHIHKSTLQVELGKNIEEQHSQSDFES